MESDWKRERGPIEQAVRNILISLFPQQAQAFGGLETINPDLYRRENCRIYEPEIFDRYFLLGNYYGDVPETEFREVMRLLSEAEAFRRKFEQMGERVPIFLNRLMQAIPSDVEKKYFNTILRTIYSIEGELQVQSEGTIWKLLKNILEQFSTNNKKRFDLLRPIFSELKFLYMLVSHVYRFGQEQNSIIEPYYRDLRQLAESRIQDAAENGTLLSVPLLAFILSRYKEWVSEAKAKAYVSTLIENDQGLCDFIARFSRLGQVKPAEMKIFTETEEFFADASVFWKTLRTG